MKLSVYSVLDKAVGAFLQPFFSRSKGEAIRSFSDAVQDKSHQFYKHASDFLLMELGVFDDHSGVFQSHEPVRIISALECIVDDEVFPPEKEVGGKRPLPM